MWLWSLPEAFAQTGPRKLPYSAQFQALVQQHLTELLQDLPSLHLKTRDYNHIDGSTVHLLLAEGTVPMYYQGVKRNIPVALWLPERYPLQAPLAYVVPTPGMVLKPRHSFVDALGQVHTPYILQWQYPACNLREMAQDMSMHFGSDPPLLSKPKGWVEPPRWEKMMGGSAGPQAQISRKPPKSVEAGAQTIAAAINAFGDALSAKVAAQGTPDGGGVFLSAYGAAQALGMAINGAEPGGESFRQLQRVVFGGAAGGGASLDALNSRLRGLSQALVESQSSGVTVANASSAWLSGPFKLQARYAATLREAFGAEVQPLVSAAVVNSWVAEATRGKITRIINDAFLQARQDPGAGTLLLINCIHFKGQWEERFEPPRHATDFTPLQHDAPPLKAAMMEHVFKGGLQVATALPATTAGGTQIKCAAVQLPYRGGEFYAVAAMPTGTWSFKPAAGGQRALATAAGAVPYAEALAACRQAVLANLPPSSAAACRAAPGAAGQDASLAPAQHWRQRRDLDVHVYLPKFKIEFEVRLADALRDLGLTRPFLFAGSDLTQVFLDKEGHPIPAVVEDVLQKVYIKADETGTEAAAVTMAIFPPMCAIRQEIELKFDRPFVFAVVHGPSGLALFAGEVHRPEVWQA